MRKPIFLAALLSMGVLAACAVEKGPSSYSPSGVKADHPALSEAEKLTPCFECHKEATPELYTEWYQSGHGLDSVRCFQCHGTYENMKRVPDEAVCSVCHSGEFHRKPAGTSCWQCHPEHSFSAHK